MTAPAASHGVRPRIRSALLHSIAFAVASLVTYDLTTEIVGRLESVSPQMTCSAGCGP
jgi:hypothetical protein